MLWSWLLLGVLRSLSWSELFPSSVKVRSKVIKFYVLSISRFFFCWGGGLKEKLHWFEDTQTHKNEGIGLNNLLEIPSLWKASHIWIQWFVTGQSVDCFVKTVHIFIYISMSWWYVFIRIYGFLKRTVQFKIWFVDSYSIYHMHKTCLLNIMYNNLSKSKHMTQFSVCHYKQVKKYSLIVLKI